MALAGWNNDIVCYLTLGLCCLAVVDQVSSTNYLADAFTLVECSRIGHAANFVYDWFIFL